MFNVVNWSQRELRYVDRRRQGLRMKSCRIFPLLAITCSLLWTAIEATPYQACPPVPDDVGGICSEDCSSDDSCPDSQMCCSNGCGHVCMDPITIPYHAPPPSLCPSIDDDVAGTCEERCTADSECVEGQLCCSNGCGHVCSIPMPSCKAVYQQVSNQSLIGSYLPQCEEDGSFSRQQCHGSINYCWCVEPEGGRPVSDVVINKMPQCNCTYDGVVHFSGETFAAGDGCNNCTCTLDGEVRCTNVKVPCQGQQLFYSCPAVREGVAGICEHQCSLHSECPHSQKCCYNGCGHTCQSPVTIPYVLLSEATSCPSPNEVPCLRQEGTMGSCHDPQFACNKGEICCDNGCSSAVCLSLSNLTPCYTAKRVLLGNSTAPLLGAYRPMCESDGRFKEIQCHEHYCWCVENSTGRPRTDMVPFEKIGSLECSTCVYNGRVYHNNDNFPSDDGCNQCTCYGGSIGCTEMGCFPYGNPGGRGQDDDDDDSLWVWWHTVLIVCIIVVVLLGVIVSALVVCVCVLIKQNGQYTHQKLKEVVPEKFEPDEEVQFKTGQDSIELKVPVEDVEDHKPAHA